MIASGAMTPNGTRLAAPTVETALVVERALKRAHHLVSRHAPPSSEPGMPADLPPDLPPLANVMAITLPPAPLHPAAVSTMAAGPSSPGPPPRSPPPPS